jgi:hypothetical protein
MRLEALNANIWLIRAKPPSPREAPEVKEMASAQRISGSIKPGWVSRNAFVLVVGTSLVALLLSLIVPMTFPWKGTLSQQAQAVQPALLTLLLVCVVGALGLLVAIRGLEYPRFLPSNGERWRMMGTSLLAVTTLMGSLLQVFLYIFMFSFIGG